MTLNETFGSLSYTGTEQNLFAKRTDLKHYGITIFFDDLVDDDHVQIKVLVNDPQDNDNEKIYTLFVVTDFQTDPAVFIPFLPTSSYRITAEKIAGADRTITWARYEDG